MLWLEAYEYRPVAAPKFRGDSLAGPFGLGPSVWLYVVIRVVGALAPKEGGARRFRGRAGRNKARAFPPNPRWMDYAKHTLHRRPEFAARGAR